jgi:5-methylcytosine-specific restriction enzyme subunit McrC
MLEYAYDLKSFHILEGLFESDSLSDVYERLALIMAKRILTRLRQGIYRTYIPQTEQLPYIRGQIVISQLVNTPWKVDHHCNYQEHTADVEENQLLAWTLYRIIRSGICSERSLPTLRQAYRRFEGAITLKPFCPEDCINRLYNRLNDDYKPLHGLCRFFLEHSGPQNKLGNHTTLPFLVNMDRLFEKFVAAWIRSHPIHGLVMDDQVKFDITEDGEIYFSIDLVLYDDHSGETKWVLDTKYKDSDTPSADDIQQVVAYAEAKRCTEAVLIYPSTRSKPFYRTIGDISVRSLNFSIGEDLEAAGKRFIDELLITK